MSGATHTGRAAASVELRGVAKRFGQDVLAVAGVDLHVEGAELVTLLGPSGCGKTTALRMIAGLEQPSAGRILLDGEDVTRTPAHLRGVGMVFQSYALFPHLDVSENVAYGLRVARATDVEVGGRVREALALVGLEAHAGRAVAALSGGEQQRVALARALAIQPRVLLFDEPLSNLDARLRRRVRDEIRALQRRLAITSVYVTHDREEALAISDRIVVLNRGAIEQIGTPYAVYTEPATRFVAEFVGEANFLPGRWDGDRVDVLGQGLPHRQDIATGPVTVMVRPEGVEIASDVAGGIAATCTGRAYLGPVTEFRFDAGGHEVVAAVTACGAAGPRPGEPATLRFAPQGVWLLPR